MTEKAEALLSLALEIEGLILLIGRREDKTPPEVVELLKSKVAKLKSSVELLSLVKSYSPVAAAAEYEEAQDAAGTPVANVAAVDMSVVSVQAPTAAPVRPLQPMVVHEEKKVVKSSPEPAYVQAHRQDISAIAPAPKTKANTSAATPLIHNEEAETLGDMYKAFTLNDKFRFRRELFSGNDAEFKDALNVVKGMGSMDEVEDYFYNDLCWDPDSDIVKDFIAVVAEFFKS